MLVQNFKPVQVKEVPPVPKPVKLIEVDPNVPFVNRPFKFHLLRSYLTNFDGNQHPEKISENGIEHEWVGENLSM